MKRRQLIKLLGGGGLALAAGGTGLWLSIPENEETLSIASTLKKLEVFHLQNMESLGAWNLAQVFEHCAQSVEYSMTGYPEHKPDWFKQTAGPLAFAAFSSKGQMRHALDEVIPGAPALDPNAKVEVSLARFEQSLKDFEQYQGVLKAHFAFGDLSKADYARAHAMHFNNHLLELVPSEVG